MNILEVQSAIKLSDFVRGTQDPNKPASSHAGLIRNLVLDNCENSTLCSDVRNVDVNKYTRGLIVSQAIPILRDVFVDNVCLFKLVPSDTIKNGVTSECGSGCTAIDTVVRLFNALPENVEAPITLERKPLRTVNFRSKGNSVVSTMILERIAADPRILERYRAISPSASPTDFGYITYKIALSANSFEDTFRFLQFAELHLIERGLFLQDFDLTKDVGCSFDKKRLVDLISADDPHGVFTVIQNDSTVGTQCLTFMYTCPNTGIVIRFKIYNKFIQSLQTAGVADMFGYSLQEWINNKDPKMRASVLKSLDYGFTRLEMTVYASKLQDVSWYLEKMHVLQEQTLDTGTMMQTPISEQWRAYANELTCNMAVIDLVSMEIGIAMWANSLTQRVCGVLVRIPKSMETTPVRLQDWVAAHYSFTQGPINIVTIEKSESLEDGYLQTTLRSFRKIGGNMVTYFPIRARGGSGFVYSRAQRNHRSEPAFRENNPTDVGLVDTSTASLRIFDKLINLQESALACEFTQEIPLVDKLMCRNTRQRNAAAREALDVEALAMEMSKIRIANDLRHETAEKERALVARQKELEALVVKNLSVRVAVSLLTAPNNTTVRVHAFKPVNTRWETQKYIIYADCGTFWANSYVIKCIENNKEKFDIHKDGYFFKRGLDHVFSFVRADNSSIGATTYARVHSFYLFKQEEVPEQSDQHVLEVIPAFRNKDLLLMDKLEENHTFEIQGIKRHEERGKPRYHVLIEGKYYLSNNWFEQAILARFDAIIEGGVWVECKSLGRETSKISRKKELQFVL